jgi:asparagine synthase (glutamine-hydrolysing)
MVTPESLRGFPACLSLKRKKRGFAANVVYECFRDSLRKKLKGPLFDMQSLTCGILRPAEVMRLLIEHITRQKDNYKILFSILVFEEWLRSV